VKSLELHNRVLDALSQLNPCTNGESAAWRGVIFDNEMSSPDGSPPSSWGVEIFGQIIHQRFRKDK
jgi:hypothetical protein